MVEWLSSDTGIFTAMITIVIVAVLVAVGYVFFRPQWQWINDNKGALGFVAAVATPLASAIVYYFVTAPPSPEPAYEAVLPDLPQTAPASEPASTETARPSERPPQTLTAPPAVTVVAPRESTGVSEPSKEPFATADTRAVGCAASVDAAAGTGRVSVVVASFGSGELTSIAESVVSQSDGLELAASDADICAQDVQISGSAKAAPRVENQARDKAILRAYGLGDQIADAPDINYVLKATAKVEARFVHNGTRIVEERTVEEHFDPNGDQGQVEARAKERATRVAVQALAQKIADRQ